MNMTSASLWVLHCAKRGHKTQPCPGGPRHCSTRGGYQELGARLRKLFVGVRKSFTEEMTPEMALETEELIHRQQREAERKCELSQRGRNPPRCMPEKWKEALYKFLKQRNSYMLPDCCFHSKLRLCLLGHLVFRPY